MGSKEDKSKAKKKLLYGSNVLIAVLLGLWVVTACNSIEEVKVENENMNEAIIFREGVYRDQMGFGITNPPFPIDFSRIMNQDKAIGIANAVFSELQQNSLEYTGFVLLEVFFDTEEQAWIAHYFLESSAPEEYAIIGSGLAIAVSAEDGRILNIWRD